MGKLTVYRRLSWYQSVAQWLDVGSKRHYTMLITVCKRCRRLLDAQLRVTK